MLKRMGITIVSACAAHLLTWCAGLWFAFGPVYQGVSVTPTVPGEVESNATRHTATLVEQNGLWVIWLLILPVLITGLVLLVIRLTDTGQLGRKVLLWTLTLTFLAFCAVGIFSIGLFYLPSGLALMCAAITGSVGRPGKTGPAGYQV